MLTVRFFSILCRQNNVATSALSIQYGFFGYSHRFCSWSGDYHCACRRCRCFFPQSLTSISSASKWFLTIDGTGGMHRITESVLIENRSDFGQRVLMMPRVLGLRLRLLSDEIFDVNLLFLHGNIQRINLEMIILQLI